MKKLSLIAIMSVLVPALAGAQTKPTPPTPPVPPSPPSVPAPPAPPAPVMIPSLNGAYTIDAQLLQERARELTERALANTDRFRVDEARVRAEVERAQAMTYAYNSDFEFAQTMSGSLAQTWSQSDSERSLYDRGQSLLSQRQYEQAIAQFDKAIAAKGTRIDGALYWKAFAQFKLGRAGDANATLGELQKSFKESKYLPDAKALEAEIKRTGGQAARPENEDDEDLKLLALQGLVNSDPERAIPLVQGVIASAGSLKLKDRALYVLALSSSPQAHTILVNTAKNGTPDLQTKAISYLGVNRGRDGVRTSIAELVDIYNASQNDSVKRAVISAIGTAGGRNVFVTSGNLTYAGPGQNVVRAQAEVVRNGAARAEAAAPANTEAQTALWSIYQKESSKDLKSQVLTTLGSMGAYDRVIDVAKSEKDADLRAAAIRSLGNMRMDKSGAALAELYPSLPDANTKKSAIHALANQNNAEALIAIARKETDRELKRTIVERLANMPKNKAAQDYLMEIIK